MIQAHIFYSGTVQGIGFRYTTQSYAQLLHLKGWVKNLSDGRVEIFVAGPRPKIEELCLNIDTRFDGYIQNKTIDFFEGNSTFDGFQIVT